MASGAAGTTRVTEPAGPPVVAEVAGEQVIDQQLRRARQVKLIDMATRALIGVVGLVAYLLLVVWFDHWIWDLGGAGRWLALPLLLAGAGWYFVRHVAWVAWRAINPVYAAHVIEEGTPSLQNSLINYLLLRQQRGTIHESVYRAIQQRAAADVGSLEVESTVDHSPLLKLGYVLAAVLAVAGAYKILSPKDPLPTVRRVLSPWATIARPSRVRVLELKPGDAQVFLGDTVPVTARLQGLAGNESVVLVYSTEDGQTVERRVEMQASSDGRTWQANLPPESGGLQQNVIYRLEAGDAITPAYRLEARPAPLIAVERVEYDYPPYMARSRRVVERQGDLSAWEGVRVTLHAHANQPIRSAWIEFAPSVDEGSDAAIATLGDDRSPVPADRVLHLQVEGRNATQSFTLDLTPDRRRSRYAAYAVRFLTAEGQRGARPVIHRIEVIPDFPPEVEILTPAADRVEVAEDGDLPFEIRAVDPDFGLRRLSIEGRLAGSPAFDRVLLEDAVGVVGQVVQPWKLVPRELGLKAGDQVVITALADDNRAPPPTFQHIPNQPRSRELLVEVVAARNRESTANKPDRKSDEPASKSGDKQSGDKQSGDKQSGDKQSGDKQSGDKQSGDKQSGDKQSGDKQSGDKQSGDKQSGDKQSGDKQSGDKQSGDKQSGDKQSGDKQSGDKQSGDKQSGDKQSGDKQSGDKQSGDKQSGDKQSGDKQSGDKQSGDKQSGDKQSGDKQSGDKQSGDKQSGDKQSGDKQSGDKQSGDKQSGDKQSGDKQSGDSKSSDQQTGESGGSDGESGGNQEKPQDVPGSRGATGAAESASGPNDAPGQPLDDGDVFDKALEHLRNEQQKQASREGGREGRPGGSENSPPKGGSPSGAKPDAPPEGASRQEQGLSPKPEMSDVPPVGKPEGKPGSAGLDKKSQGAGTNNDAANRGGESGRSEGPAETKSDVPMPPAKPEGGAKPKPGSGTNGETGAGTASKEQSASPDASKENVDRPKKTPTGDSKPSEAGEPPAPSESKRQSDSKSDTEGDKSGGGKQGGGQGANQKGNDSAGSNSPADDGAGAAPEAGAGATTSKAGSQQKAPKRTGQAGQDKGEGSGSKPDAAGPSTPNQQPGAPGSGGKPADEPGQPDSAAPPNANGGASRATAGGGLPSEAASPRRPTPMGDVPEGEAANMDYARQATDLVLDYLRDQAEQPDQELLRKLGWTQQDLRDFVTRWQALKKSANENDVDAKRELDESLRSLGLRPAADRRRAASTAGDTQRNNRDAGARSNPPAKYQDRFNAYRRGTAR